MKKLSNTETELKKALFIKKAVIYRKGAVHSTEIDQLYLVTKDFKHNMPKLFWYFYLLMEKPLGCHFQVQSPYYQVAQCNQKTPILCPKPFCY